MPTNEAAQSTQSQQIQAASAKHPQPGQVFQYGTAGFRMKADLLDSVVFRCGILAALRSRKLDGQTIGVMITASHNPPQDNGIKLVDPMGEMLEGSWENHATELANAPNDEACAAVYNKLVTNLGIKSAARAHVVFARDTRPSGPLLIAALKDGITAAGAEYTDLEYLTTPQLHYMVRCLNTKNTQLEYGEPTEEGYYEKLANALKVAMKHRKSTGSVVVDCANGVGGPKLREMLKAIPSAEVGGLNFEIVNEDISRPEILNVQCGADHVKVQQKPPIGYKYVAGNRFASFDGDADRLMYYFTDIDTRFYLLDGDRIATLAASFLGDLGRQSGLAESLRIGVVQTAYANGASTEYITKILGLPVVCTATGVKHLHHAATRFDIGVYFEANGHGTVLFSASALKAMRKYEPKSPAQLGALEILRALSHLINQTVGDAISDMLLVEVILAHKNWGAKEWLSTYTDLPNRLTKVEVPDRNIFKTTDAERKLVSPPGLQTKINQLVSKYNSGRAFARASGTEDAVRVYAEAQTKTEADDLARKVAALVQDAGKEAAGM